MADTTTQPIAKPFLRWAGSKRQLIPKLRSYWQGHERYFEPFMGSACLFFSLAPEEAVLGDLNSELVDSYAVVRDQPLAVHNAIARLPKGKESYYEIRSQDASR